MSENVEGAVCLCTRGLLHSRTAEAIESNLDEVGRDRWTILMTHDEPIPDAQNVVVERALEGPAKWLWFVEEDIVPPAGCLKRMVDRAMADDAMAVAARYRLDGGQWAHRLSRDHRLVFAGLGCTLFRRDVFEQLDRPWFRTDRCYCVNNLLNVEESREDVTYGGHDIHLFVQMLKRGWKSVLADDECLHLRVVEFGKSRSNVGWHKVRPL